MFKNVDPFIGTEPADLPEQKGLATTWWWPKPAVGNTHPGPCYPFGMVSAAPYSGAYPTGYGLYNISTEGLPAGLFEKYQASGFTHFQHSGTGAIRKYYNYFRVTPMLGPLDVLDTQWELQDEEAEPGYYSTTLGSGIGCELTAGPKSVVHRYSFPAHSDARIVLDFSLGGLATEHGRTIPLSAKIESFGPGKMSGTVVFEGVPISVYAELSEPTWRQMPWYDKRLMTGGTGLEFDFIRRTTLRPFGYLFRGPAEAGRSIELRIGFSLRGIEQARESLYADCGSTSTCFEERKASTQAVWNDKLNKIKIITSDTDREKIFATSLYHSLIKPCSAADESPFWPQNSPFVFDFATMWDIYKTQLPLLTCVDSSMAVDIVNSLLLVSQIEGNFPIGYRLSRGFDRFNRQASALAHTLIADLFSIEMPGLDWELILAHMHMDLLRNYGEDFIEKGVAHPISHTADITYGYYCTAKIARNLGDKKLAAELCKHANKWDRAYDDTTGLLADSNFYEGGKWNYSFKLMHDMAGRIDLAGGEEKFVSMLDAFFGYGQPRVKQLGVKPSPEELAAGYALNRFEGLNNEPDIEAPWAYYYAGRPDRTAEVVHSAVHNQFATGRGGLPGNDDSGGLSSWYVWASLGLFPVAGQGKFLIHPPSWESAEITVGEKTFALQTQGFNEPSNDSPAQYVESVSLNGKKLDAVSLDMKQLHDGGEVTVALADSPTQWGHDVRPSTADCY